MQRATNELTDSSVRAAPLAESTSDGDLVIVPQTRRIRDDSSRDRPRIPPIDALNAEPPRAGEWADYEALGVRRSDIPALIDLMTDPELNDSSSPAEHWLPLHAWRALGQLGAVEATEPLIDLRIELDDDDNLGNEFARVMAGIGPAAIPALERTLARAKLDPIVRGAMAEAIGEIGVAHPSVASDAAARLAGRLERFADHAPELNSLIIGGLLDLRAVQHAGVIERAMTAGPIDEQFCGDWEDVQIELGLIDERTTPRRWRRPFALAADDAPTVRAPTPVRKGKKKRAKAKRKLATASKRRNRGR